MTKHHPPIMGWSSWNHFRQLIDEDKIYGVAKALKETGLAEAGYQYVNLDDCWQSSKRNEQGELQFDLANFPSGAKLIEKIHDLGLKVGLYSSCGAMTCEDLPASFTHEEKDAQTFANWQVDFLKYDYCHVVDLCSDENFLLMAPHVIAIELVNEETKEKYRLAVTEAQLLKGAKLQQKEAITSIIGLGAAGGKIEWHTSIPAGNYVVTIIYEKLKREERSFLVVDFGAQQTYFYFPTSSGWSLTGREQLKFTLKKKVERISAYNPIKDQKTDAQLRYQVMKDALMKVAPLQKINYEICEHGRNQPWRWAPKLADSYRITSDIQNNWSSVAACYRKGVAVAQFAKEGSYGNPDMLEVGNGALTFEENRSHFALWVFLCAPLILGNDVRNFLEKTPENLALIRLLTDPYLLKIHQTAPFLPAKFLKEGTLEIGIKYLESGEAAFFIFNPGDEKQRGSFDLKMLPEEINQQKFTFHRQSIKEIWQQDFQLEDFVVKCQVPPHGIYVFYIN